MSFLDKFKSKKPKVEVESTEELPEPKGKLAVDFFQEGQELKVIAAVAGVNPNQLDIAINNEMLIIKGRRDQPYSNPDKTYSQESYWGPFVRKIMLPEEVNEEEIEANKKEGVLTITLPLAESGGSKKIEVEE